MEFQNILNRHLMAALLTVMLGFISPVGLAGDSHSDRHRHGHGHHHRGPTILDILVRTDGTQALVAAVQVAGQPTLSGLLASQDDCSGLTDLLDNRWVDILLLAPNNNAFEKFLKLPKGGFDGMGSDTIALALPGILARLKLEPQDLCKVLLKHVSEGNNVRTASGLLRRGGITVADESELPVAVGNVGPSIAYEANITERDVFTVNGVIQYLDAVIVDAPPPDPPEQSEVCNEKMCATDPDQAQRCNNFLALCLAQKPQAAAEECLVGGLLICNEFEFEGEPEP